jgi:hypothetical protein
MQSLPLRFLTKLHHIIYFIYTLRYVPGRSQRQDRHRHWWWQRYLSRIHSPPLGSRLQCRCGGPRSQSRCGSIEQIYRVPQSHFPEDRCHRLGSARRSFQSCPGVLRINRYCVHRSWSLRTCKSTPGPAMPYHSLNHVQQPKTSFWALKSSTDAQSSSYKVLEINLHHPIRCTQLALDQATRQNSSCAVIMISSAAAQQPGTAIPLYAASKAGINNFVKSMAPMEPAKGVRVVAVAPGSVLTPFWASREGWVGEGEWIPMEEVVDAMLAMITRPEYPGGTVLEITRGSTRKIDLVNDPGPVSGTGATIANVALPRAEMIGLLNTEYGK